MLIKRYKLSDIRNYEETYDKNILSMFDKIEIHNIVDLVSLGNNNCGTEKASQILDNYLETHNLIDAILVIKEELLGKGENTDEDKEDTNLMDITHYGCLTELYENYSMQLMSIGFSYSDFWDLSSKSLYRVFNSIIIKRNNDINQQLSVAHTQAALIGQAVWGKLKNKPPQVDLVKEKQLEDMDEDQVDLVNKLNSLPDIFNKRG